MTNMRESHADARCETDRLRRVLARLRELHHFAWWAHSIYALGLGTAVAVFARKGYDHAPWVIALACAALSAAVAWEGAIIALDQWDEQMMSLDLSAGWFLVPVVIGGALCAAFFVAQAVSRTPR